MMDSKEYSLEDLVQEIQPPYEDQDRVANMLNTLTIYLERRREPELPEFLIVGFRPIIGDFLRVSQAIQEELVDCLSYLFDPYSDVKPGLDIQVIKDNLHVLSPSGLVSAINLIGNERAPDAEARIRSFLTHQSDSVRSAARGQLDEMGVAS